MAVAVTCFGCGARYRIGAAPVEKRFKCKKCGELMIVPASPDAGDVEINFAKDDAPQAPAPPPEPVAPRRTDHDPPSLEDLLPSPTSPAFTPALAISPPPIPPAGIGTVVKTPRRRVVQYQSPGRDFRRSTAAPEGFSPLLMAVFVVLTLVNAAIQASRRSDISTAIWTYAITLLVMYFLVLSPMTLLGVWIASRVARFELAPPAYLKAGAMAALPAVLIGILQFLPSNPVLSVVMVLALLPISFVVCKLVFSLLLNEALLAFVFGGILWGIGLFITVATSLAITAGGIAAQRHPSSGRDSILSQLPRETPSSPESSSSTESPANDRPRYQPAPAYVPPTPSDPVLARLDALKTKAVAHNTPGWLADASRELAASTINQLQSTLAPLAGQANTDDRRARVQEITAEIDKLKVSAPTLPSESPDPDIFKAPIDLRTWAAAVSSDVVPASYRRYQLTVPKEAAIDLGTTEDGDTGLGWTVAPAGHLVVAAVDRKLPNQLRPWVKTKSFMRANDPDLFTIDAVNIPVEVTYGTLNGIASTRIASQSVGDTGRGSGGRFRSTEARWVKYVIPDGRFWVVVTCTASIDDPQTLAALEQSAVTVRQIRAGETRVEPFTPQAVVARLPDERADVMIRRFGPAAEPALLARLNDTSTEVRKQVIELLRAVGTKKSVAPLMAIVRADDWSLSPLAKSAIKKISPEDMDDAAEAILQLQGKSFQRDDALRTLAACKPKPDDPRRVGVSTLLCDMAKDHMKLVGTDPGLVGDALAVWASPNAIASLLPMLDYSNKWEFNRGTVMVVLGHTKDKRAAFPICRWLIEDTDTAQKALIAMGPVAEDEVIKVLSQRDPKARKAAVAILAEIGTKKSLKPLASYGSSNSRDPMAKDIADSAIASIRDRMDKDAAATQPSTGQDPPKGGSPLFPDKGK